MKKSKAMAWVKALRSGKYKQGTGNLCTNNKYCCLGVLADITKGVKKVIRDRGSPLEGVYFDGRDGILDKGLNEKAGLKTENGEATDLLKISGKYFQNLAEANDAGVRFKTIANFIEKNYKKL